MSLEDDLLEWASSRPVWQQDVFKRLVQGETVTEADCRQIAAGLAGPPVRQSSPSLTGLIPQAVTASQVQLESIEVVAHVNRLQAQQTLTFGHDGLTVVYGDNASGKSGYARLIKTVARARHQEPILTNIFTDSNGSSPEARIAFLVDGVAGEITWPREQSHALARVHFYDRACGDAYISTESEVAYRPSVLVLMDQLIHISDLVRDRLDELLATNSSKKVDLPNVPDPGLGKFIANLDGHTSNAEIDAACTLPVEAEGEVAALIASENRLLASDPQKERLRLTLLADRLDTIAQHLNGLAQTMGAPIEGRLRDRIVAAAEATDAAQAAAQPAFETDPLKGTGSPLWRAMWEAARQYSEDVAYPSKRFPAVHGVELCLLCQQALADEAARRLERFASVLADTTEEQSRRAQEALETARRAIAAATPLPAKIAATLAQLEGDEQQLIVDAETCITAFTRRQQDLLRLSREAQAACEPSPTLPQFQARAHSVRTLAANLDAATFTARLAEVRSRRVEIESRKAVAAARASIESEVARRRDRLVLDAAKRTTDTTGITRKSTELARSYVTSVVRDRFTRESDRLRLERVTLQDTGGHKGQLHQKPAFLAAAQRPEMRQVLSEGEQTALGLAGFFTEAELDASKSTLVLDDPVSSLSHARRGFVAGRIAQLATDRQVIVFTHDLTFAGELLVAATRENVDVTERQIVRSRGGDPGVCLEGHPWKAKDAKRRLGDLEADLQRMKREASGWKPDEYDTRVADWSGRLSETWERILNEEITDQLVDPSTLEVHPKMIKLLARITDLDATEFEESYARVSQWARRHDKDRKLNYVGPDLGELQGELSTVRAWFERVRKYRN